jgi:hypothetical protein
MRPGLWLDFVGGAGLIAGMLNDRWSLGIAWGIGFLIVSEWAYYQQKQKETQEAKVQMEEAEAVVQEARELEAKESQRLEEEKKLQARRERWMRMRMRQKRREGAS